MRSVLAPGSRRVLHSALAAFVAISALMIAAAVPGCAPSAGVMTPREIDAHGVIVLRFPPDKVFKACLEALKSVGYEIEVESPDKGLIVTKRRSIMRDSPKEASYSRQYTIQVKSAGGLASRVTATPAMFENAT